MITQACIFTADQGDAGRRLDLVLRRHLTGPDVASRTAVQRWMESGRVSVNGVTVRRPSSRAAFGDVVAIDRPAPRARTPMAAEDTPLDVVYEDDHLLAVNKAAGVVVHPTYRNATGTLMNALLWRARGWPAAQRPSIVGRLDKLTSGVVVVAKSAGVHAGLQRAMTSADCEKEYLALVYGRVNMPRGRIDLRLDRDRGDRRRMVASATRGDASVTRFERIRRGHALTLLRCRIETGRTHQIRVHLAARGWPLVGDAVYGNAARPSLGDPQAAAAVRAFARQALHSSRIALAHPISGERLVIEAPVPDDLAGLIAAVFRDR